MRHAARRTRDGCRERRLTLRLPFPDRRPTEGGKTQPVSPSIPVPDAFSRRFLLSVALVALVALTSFAFAPGASAKAKTCGEKVVDDWYGDGRVDEIFPTHCYLDAIRSLPVDVKDYSNAEEDIRRALAYARQHKPDPGPGGGLAPTATGPAEPPTSTTGTGGRHRRRTRCRHLRPLIGADPAADPGRARAAPPRGRRRRIPEPPCAGAPQRRASRTGVAGHRRRPSGTSRQHAGPLESRR